MAVFTALALNTAMTSQAVAQVEEAYVYNGDYFKFHGMYGANAGNEVAHALVFKGLGMLDANGRPPQIDLAVDNFIRQGDTIVGRVIHCNGDPGLQDACIYETLDGKKRAYDLSNSGTMRQAWEEVAADGRITIIKHGLEIEDPGFTLYGGALALDEGKFYDGFKTEGDSSNTGTGIAGPHGPYELPARPGASIDLELIVCYSAGDFDGAGPGISVADSAGNIPGMGTVNGGVLRRYGGCVVEFPGATEKQKRAARRIFDAKASKRGFFKKNGSPDRAAMLRAGTLKVRVNMLEYVVSELGITYKLTWYQVDNPALAPHCELVDFSGEGWSVTPVPQGCPAVGIEGGTIRRDADGPERNESLTSTLSVYGGAVPNIRPIEIVETQVDELMIPAGLAPVTAPITVRQYGVDGSLDLAWESELFIDYPEFGPEPVGLYKVEPDGTLVPDDFGWYDPWAFVAGTLIQDAGTYVLLGEAVDERTADFNFDRRVDIDDLLELFEVWGDCEWSWCQHDLNDDQDIGVDDLLGVLGQWGSDF